MAGYPCCCGPCPKYPSMRRDILVDLTGWADAPAYPGTSLASHLCDRINQAVVVPYFGTFSPSATDVTCTDSLATLSEANGKCQWGTEGLYQSFLDAFTSNPSCGGTEPDPPVGLLAVIVYPTPRVVRFSMSGACLPTINFYQDFGAGNPIPDEIDMNFGNSVNACGNTVPVSTLCDQSALNVHITFR